MTARVATVLEHRYHALMRAYPAHYRDARADEVVGTLMDAAREDQRWPRVREALPLVAAGLRMRAGGHLRRRATSTWAAGLQWAVLVLLAYLAANWTLLGLVRFAEPASGPVGVPFGLPALAAGLAAAVGLSLVARVRLRGGMALLAIGVVAAYLADGGTFTPGPWRGLVPAEWWAWPVAGVMLVACLVLRRRSAVPPQPAAWLLAIPVLLLVARNDIGPGMRYELFWTAILVGLAWALVDARVGVAASGLVLTAALERAATALDLAGAGRLGTNLDYAWWAAAFGAVALTMLVLSTVGARRQARL